MLLLVVPVFPAATRPPASADFFAVPSLRTLLIAYSTALVIRCSSTWWQPASGMGSSLPVVSVTLVIATGEQNVPLAAKVASAAAIVSGATSLVPRIMDGKGLILAPSARWKPRLSATFVMSHR